MLALVNTPSAAIAVELNEVPEPVPMPDEAIVEVHAFSLNRGELALLASRPEGWRPGQDVAGIIVQPAADGSGPEKGTRVVAWVDGAGWSQRVAAPTVRMAALPDNVSFASAATLPVAGVTALRILRQGLQLARAMNNRLQMATDLALPAGAIGALGEAQQAARLLGASERALERLGAFHQLNDKPEIDAIITAVRAQLNEVTFLATWAQGRELTLEQAVAETLDV